MPIRQLVAKTIPSLAGTIVVALAIWLWSWVTDGNLVRELGGITVEQFQEDQWKERLRGHKGERGERGERGAKGDPGIFPLETIAALIPSGAVVAFDRVDIDQDTCPPGWGPFMESRGRVIVGAGDPSKAPGEFGSDESGTPLTNRTLRQRGGAEKHALTVGEMARHHHSVTPLGWGHSATGNGRPLRLIADDGPPWNDNTGALIAGATGGSTPHNNMPPYISLYLCKKE